MSTDAKYGTPYDPPSRADDGRPSALAWVTLAFGIASWIALPLVGAALAVVCGLIEWRKIAEMTSSKKGRLPVKVGLVAASAQLVAVVFVSGVGVLSLIVEALAAIGG